MAPETCVVNTPDAKVAVVPVVVVPVKEVKVPVVAAIVVPVMVVPLSVPVTKTFWEKKPVPKVLKLPETTVLVKARLVAARV